MRKVVVLVGSLLFLDVLLLEVERADACSCHPVNPTRAPQHGATGVVVNAAIVARVGVGQSVELRTGAASVAIDSEEIARGFVAIKPRLPLSPNTRYEVLVDNESSTFMTGDQLDETPPAAATLRAITPETMSYPINGCVSSCVLKSSVQGGHISRIGVDHDLPSDAVFAVIELRDEATDTIDRRPVSELLGFSVCDQTVAPILEPEGSYCARIVSYDAAGQTSHSEEVCSDAKRCNPIADPNSTNQCDPAPVCMVPALSGCAVGGYPAGLAVVMLALSPGWSRRSARRRRARATPPAP
jgi:hypothetical protein